MGLLNNGYRHNLTGRMFGPTAIDGGNPSVLRTFTKPASKRNMLVGDAIANPLAAVPDGYRHPGAWIMPRKAGALSSRNTTFLTFTPTGAMLRGYPISGTSDLTITTNTPSGELIVSGDGSASVTLSTNNPLLTASIGGTGSTTITISTNVPILGAEASLQGEASITVTVANATAFPLNDASPLRDASATFTVSGSLTPYAIGHMVGSTVDNSVLTADSITAAVWNAILADFNENGTAGKALASAGSGGVDLEALAQAILAAAQVTPIHANTKLINDAVVIGDGLAGNDWRGVGVPPTVV